MELADDMVSTHRQHSVVRELGAKLAMWEMLKFSDGLTLYKESRGYFLYFMPFFFFTILFYKATNGSTYQ